MFFPLTSCAHTPTCATQRNPRRFRNPHRLTTLYLCRESTFIGGCPRRERGDEACAASLGGVRAAHNIVKEMTSCERVCVFTVSCRMAMARSAYSSACEVLVHQQLRQLVRERARCPCEGRRQGWLFRSSVGKERVRQVLTVRSESFSLPWIERNRPHREMYVILRSEIRPMGLC